MAVGTAQGCRPYSRNPYPLPQHCGEAVIFRQLIYRTHLKRKMANRLHPSIKGVEPVGH